MVTLTAYPTQNRNCEQEYYFLIVFSSVADPHWFQCESGSSILGPDPGFY
jgi:hypothetical protein